MFLKISFLVCSVFVFCESSFVDTLGKCKFNDGACEKALFQSIITDISKSGVPELGIPQIDPISLKNISLSVLDVIDMTLVEGNAKGVKDCVVTKIETNIEDERAVIELVCDLTIKGHYKVFSNSPLIKTLVGGSVTGDGNAKIKIEKLHLKFDFDLYILRRNGEIYVRCRNDKLKYTYDIGRMFFVLDNLYIGKQESSKLVTGMLNDNWRILMPAFGKPFMDKAMDITYDFLYKFFAGVPAKYYISDDLSKYAKDE